MPRYALLINESSGGMLDRDPKEFARLVESRLREAGAEVATFSADRTGIDTALEQAADAARDGLIVAAGDGTIMAAARVAIERGIALGVIPMGTVNLLARDIGMGTDVEGAVKVIASGHTRKIDAAEVNGAPFLCSSILGVVPMLGKERERHRAESPLQFWPSMAGAAVRMWKRDPRLHLRIASNGSVGKVTTRALAVFNNPVKDHGALMLARASLDGGRLAVYLSRHRSRGAFVMMALRFLIGKWQHARGMETHLLEEIVISSRRKWLMTCNDGEIVRMRSPLRYRIRARALEVFAPQVEAEAPAPAGGGEAVTAGAGAAR